MPGIPSLHHGMVTIGLLGLALGGYFILAYAMMGSVVDYDEMYTNARWEAIYYGTFSLAASIGLSLAALLLPFIFKTFGYSSGNPFGVQLTWLIAAAFAFLGALSFIGYKLGDTPSESRKNLGLF
ncbi:MAG: MFS transporter [Anaerolineales bacterium]|nr:MFS transporter [Anaerolineales bacterium]